MKRFGEQLAEWIDAANLTQQRVADSLGMSQPGVSSWIVGRSLPSARRAPELARILGVPLAEVVTCIATTAEANLQPREPEKPDIPEGAALLSGRLKDLSADDIHYINDLIEKLSEW